METVTVHRIEDVNGYGAFNSMPWEVYAEFVALHDITHPNLFPTPYLDWELQDDPNFERVEGHGVFGCCSKDTLQEWFPEHTMPMLTEGGLQYTVWEVPTDAIARSDRQAAFLRDKAKLVERHPAAALYAEPEPLKEAA